MVNRPSFSFPGPGPGRYNLPTCVGSKNADVTKRSMPAYSFGRRLENPSELSLVWKRVCILYKIMYCHIEITLPALSNGQCMAVGVIAD